MLVAMQNSEVTMGNSIDTYVPAIPEVDIPQNHEYVVSKRYTLFSCHCIYCILLSLEDMKSTKCPSSDEDVIYIKAEICTTIKK